jgi:hypothetical protein
MDGIGINGDDFGRVLEDARQALTAFRPDVSSAGPAPGAPAEPLRGEGTAADGKISVQVISGGHVEELTVDPRLMRLGSQELCAQIVVAVNAAMDDLRSQTAQAGPSVMDPAALAEALEGLQTESVRQMSRFTEGVAETVAKINAAASGGAGRGR